MVIKLVVAIAGSKVIILYTKLFGNLYFDLPRKVPENNYAVLFVCKIYKIASGAVKFKIIYKPL